MVKHVIGVYRWTLPYMCPAVSDHTQKFSVLLDKFIMKTLYQSTQVRLQLDITCMITCYLLIQSGDNNKYMYIFVTICIIFALRIFNYVRVLLDTSLTLGDPDVIVYCVQSGQCQKVTTTTMYNLLLGPT